MKNTSKSVLALAVASLFIASFAFAATTDKPAVESKVAGCCAKAAKDEKACTHGECCVAAAKAGMNCEKCGGKGKAPAPAPAPAKP